MGVNLVANPFCFLSQTELGCGLQHAESAFLGQIFERRLTAARPRQWNIGVKHLGQGRGINAHLRDIAIRCRAREEFAPGSLDKNMEHSRIDSGIGSVTMCFPTAIKQIDLDEAATRLAPTYPNCSVTKVRTSSAVPSAELDHFDLVLGRADDLLTE